LLSGVISFVIYSIEKRKKASPFLGLLLIPFLAGVLGSGSPQWCRYLYMYQAYVDPLSLHQTLCPRNYTGKWTEWYPNGRKKSELNLQNGLLHGTPAEIEWYPSGQMKSKKDYIDGRRYYTVSYYENGQKETETNVIDGTVKGITTWYENGQKKSEIDFADETVTGKRPDDVKQFVTSWYPNGQITYEYNKKTRQKRSWNEDGSVCEGQVTQCFGDSEKIRSIKQFKDGLWHGTQTW
jgi:antitoxin component YwqK of YwqJK toxin-antitoxin module